MITLIKQERALLFTSFFAILLRLMRIQYLGGPCRSGLEMIRCSSMRFVFLIWNLILAWIPLLITYMLTTRPLTYWIATPAILIWLLFFPNAPYLITDLIHLKYQAYIPLWYDAFLLFTFAYIGIWLAIRALHRMQAYLTLHWNKQMSQFIILITLLLTGLGIYLGRVERWNSWDLFTRPGALLNSVFELLCHPFSNPQACLMIFTFSTLMGLMYWLSLKTTD